MPDNTENYYTLLNIDITATTDEIRKAYNKAALKWHPDKNRNNLKAAELAMVQINIARDTLVNDDQRKAYNKKIGIQTNPFASQSNVNNNNRASNVMIPVKIKRDESEILLMNSVNSYILRTSSQGDQHAALSFTNANNQIEHTLFEKDTLTGDWVTADLAKIHIDEYIKSKYLSPYQPKKEANNETNTAPATQITKEEFKDELSYYGMSNVNAKIIANFLYEAIEKKSYPNALSNLVNNLKSFSLETLNITTKSLDRLSDQLGESKNKTLQHTLNEISQVITKQTKPIVHLANQFNEYKSRIETAIQAAKSRESLNPSAKHNAINELKNKLIEVESEIKNGNYKNFDDVKNALKISIDNVTTQSEKAQKNPFRKSMVAEKLKEVVNDKPQNGPGKR